MLGFTHKALARGLLRSFLGFRDFDLTLNIWTTVYRYYRSLPNHCFLRWNSCTVVWMREILYSL